MHEYLGMTIGWTVDGRVMFTMYNYLEDILAKEPADFDGEDVTPTVSDLHQVNGTFPKLDMATVDLFHRIVARFLYVAKRARPDLQVVVAFLFKQMKCPHMDDWKKLGRLIRYVQATINFPLIHGSDGTRTMV